MVLPKILVLTRKGLGAPAGVEPVDGAHHPLGAVDLVHPVRQHPAVDERRAGGGARENRAEVVDQLSEIGLQVGAVARVVVGCAR